jgi:hypothetical protein
MLNQKSKNQNKNKMHNKSGKSGVVGHVALQHVQIIFLTQYSTGSTCTTEYRYTKVFTHYGIPDTRGYQIPGCVYTHWRWCAHSRDLHTEDIKYQIPLVHTYIHVHVCTLCMYTAGLPGYTWCMFLINFLKR